MTIMANLVAIVGRPNVGKSTLFNRLTQSRRAIVSDTAGTTRDRQYGKCSWNGREFSVMIFSRMLSASRYWLQQKRPIWFSFLLM